MAKITVSRVEPRDALRAALVAPLHLLRRLVLKRLVAAAAFALAVMLGAYTGFRVPNTWITTLDAVSLTDGFHRRFVIGTLLRPLAIAHKYDYWLFATEDYLVLFAVLVVLGIAVVRTTAVSRRFWIAAWMVLPTGGFLFHEVGYFEQALYLLLFVSMWLVWRKHLAIASCLMSITPFIHECALVTVIPVFGVALLRSVPLRRALALISPSVALGLFVLAIAPASADAVGRLSNVLQTANFAYRHDALALFERTQEDSWRLYSLELIFSFVLPFAQTTLIAFLSFTVIDRDFRQSWRARLPLASASVVAFLAPVLLAYGGWDGNRWAFLVLTNFFVVVWMALGDREHPLGFGSTAVLAVTLWLLAHMSLYYFDGYVPRQLTLQSVEVFAQQVRDHSLFVIPPK
jgi:hypothetical protein